MSNPTIFYLYTIFMNGRLGRGVLMLYSLSIGLNALEFGFLQSTYNLTRMLSEIPTGMIADRYNQKYILSLGALLNSASSLGLCLMASHNSPYRVVLMALLFMLDAFASVLASGADQALLFEDLKSRGQEQRYLNIISNVQTIALLVLAGATALGGSVYQTLYSNVFAIQALFYLLAALVILTFKSNSISSHPQKTEAFTIKSQILSTLRTLKNSHAIRYLILAITLIEVYVNSLVTFGQGSFASREFSDSLIAIIIGGVTLCGILGAYLARFLDKLSIHHFLQMLTLIFALAVFFFSENSRALMVLGFTLANLLLDLAFPYVSSAINLSVDNHIRSTVLSAYSSLVGSLSLLLYPLLGFLMDFLSYQTAFLISGIAISLSLLFLVFKSKSLT